MQLSDLKSPIVGYVLTLIFVSFSAVGWLRAEIAALNKDAEKRDQGSARLIASRDRETDDLKARLASLEMSARNCKP